MIIMYNAWWRWSEEVYGNHYLTHANMRTKSAKSRSDDGVCSKQARVTCLQKVWTSQCYLSHTFENEASLRGWSRKVSTALWFCHHQFYYFSSRSLSWYFGHPFAEVQYLLWYLLWTIVYDALYSLPKDISTAQTFIDVALCVQWDNMWLKQKWAAKDTWYSISGKRFHMKLSSNA